MNSIKISIGDCSCFEPDREVILLHNPPSELDEEKLHIFYGDVISHEFIHYTIYKMFNNNEDISILFDIVESYFRLPESDAIRKRAYNSNPHATQWNDWIELWGVKEFLDLYWITKHEFMVVSMYSMFRKLDGLNYYINKLKYKFRIYKWRFMK